MGAGKDFSEWLATGRGSDVRLHIVLEQQQPQQVSGAQPQEDQGQQEAPAAKRHCSMHAGDAAAAATPPPPLPPPGPARCVLEDIAAHSLVLEEGSGWARVLLSSPESRESQQRVLELVVASEGEGAAARLVVEALYAGDAAASLRGQPQLTLLQVLQLADRLQAPRCVEATAQALAAAELDWDTVLAIWQLPGGCADNPAYAAAYSAAEAAVQARLGDVDVTMADKCRRAQLHALPLPALVKLLQSDATRASSENMVFAACAEWRSKHKRAVAEGSAEEAQLAACVRQQHISRLYHASVVSRSAWFTRHADVAAAAAHFAAPKFAQLAMLGEAEYEAFSTPRRPASAVTQGVIDSTMPLADVKAWFESNCDDDAAPSFSGDRIFGGYRWHLHLLEDDYGAVGIGIQLAVPPGTSQAGPAAAEVCLEVMSGPPGGTRYAVQSWKGEAVRVCSGDLPGCSDLFFEDAGGQFDEAAWRGAGYVSEGDAVHVRCTISKVY